MHTHTDLCLALTNIVVLPYNMFIPSRFGSNHLLIHVSMTDSIYRVDWQRQYNESELQPAIVISMTTWCLEKLKVKHTPDHGDTIAIEQTHIIWAPFTNLYWEDMKFALICLLLAVTAYAGATEKCNNLCSSESHVNHVSIIIHVHDNCRTWKCYWGTGRIWMFESMQL
jgi:hypothetical protein